MPYSTGVKLAAYGPHPAGVQLHLARRRILDKSIFNDPAILRANQIP